MRAVLYFVTQVLSLYSFVVIACAIMSWLLAFDVVNFRNQLVRSIWNFLNAVTEPVLRPIRNVIPNLGGVDVSPVILLLLIQTAQFVIREYIYPNVF